MGATEEFSNNPSTTVVSGGTDAPASGTTESWTVASSAEFPAASTGSVQFHIGDPAQPSELILVTNVSGTAWTVTRGAESSVPVAHASGFTVTQVVTAGWLNEVGTGAGITPPAGDIGGNTVSPTVVSTHLGSPLPLVQGGTGGSTATAAFNTFSPLTTLGDTLYGGASGVGTRLAGNTAATRKFMLQTGTGSVSAAPQWGTLVAGDVPPATSIGPVAVSGTAAANDVLTATSNTSAQWQLVNAANLTGILPVVNGGTGGTQATAYAVVAGGTTATSVFQQVPAGTAGYVLTSAGAGTLPVFQVIPAATTSVQGAVTFNGTAATLQPAGVAAAGTVGTVPDTAHVHPNFSVLSLYTAPSGATGETFPRAMCTGNATPSSGRLQAAAIGLPAGLPVNNLTFTVTATAAAGLSHGWYVLLDSGGTVRAVTADQTSGTWGTANTSVTLSVAASAYTTTYSGLYYAGWMVAAGTVCTMAIAGNLTGGIASAAPVLCGTYGSGLTTPPAAGSAITLSGNGFWSLYAYTS